MCKYTYESRMTIVFFFCKPHLVDRTTNNRRTQEVTNTAHFYKCFIMCLLTHDARMSYLGKRRCPCSYRSDNSCTDSVPACCSYATLWQSDKEQYTYVVRGILHCFRFAGFFKRTLLGNNSIRDDLPFWKIYFEWNYKKGRCPWFYHCDNLYSLYNQ